MAGGIIGNLMFAVGFKVNPSALTRAQQQTAKLEKSWQKAGVAAAAFGAAITGIGFAATNAAMEFEKSMLSIQGATGATAAQMEETRGIATNLYNQNFGQSWDDLAKGITSVQQITGQTGVALEETTKNALLLRDTFGIEVNESARAAKTMIENFGISSQEAFNLMAQGSQQGLDFSGELVDTINEYSLQFKSLGFEADDMFNTLAVGSAKGAFNLDKVADAVKEFGIRSKDAGDAGAVEAFEMLGLNAEQMMGIFARGGPEAKKSFTQITQMIEAIEDPVQQNAVAVGLFGTQFEDLQKDVITAMGHVDDKFDMTKQTMETLNEIKFSSPGEAAAMFGRQLETGLLIPLGQKLLPTFNEMGQWMTDNRPQIEAFGAALGDNIGKAIEFVSTKAQELWPQIKSIGETILETGKAFVTWQGFLPTVMGLVGAITLYKTTVGAVTAVTQAWTAIQAIKNGVLVVYRGIVTGINAVTKGWAAVQLALNAAMYANPIGLIVLAVVALIGVFVLAYKRSDKFRAIIDKAWAGIKVAAGVALKFFTETIPKGFNVVVNFIKTWGGRFLSFLVNPVKTGVDLVKQHWDKIKGFAVTVFNGIIDFLREWGPVLLAALMGPTGIAVALVIKYWDKIKATTVSVFNSVKTTISNAWDSIKNKVITTGSNIWTDIKGVWTRVTTFLSEINLFEIGKDIIQGLINGVSSMAESLATKVEEMGNGITEKVKSTLGIHSPSRVMMEMGFFTGEGLAQGIEGTQNRVRAAATDVTNEVIPQNPASLTAAPLPPAKATGSGVAGKMDISINIDLKADASSANVSQDVAATVRAEVQKVLDEFSRRFGVQLEVSG